VGVHAPALHFVVKTPWLEHLCPHWPQVAGAANSDSQPSLAAVALQSAKPVLHTGTHLLAVHAALVALVTLQVMSQVPQ
jgi:hypothetical protein